MTVYKDSGLREGGKCAKLPCLGKATHYHTVFKEWYCYYCAIQINGTIKKKLCINGKEYMMQALIE